MATPFTPTPAQAMLGIEHPFYEMDQMIFCAAALRSEPDVFAPQVGFALAESFVIHARSLLHFFFDDHKHKPTDLLAGDFVVNPTAWRRAYPAPSKLLEDFKIRVDTEVAHVTSGVHRVEPRSGNASGDDGAEPRAWGVDEPVGNDPVTRSSLRCR